MMLHTKVPTTPTSITLQDVKGRVAAAVEQDVGHGCSTEDTSALDGVFPKKEVLDFLRDFHARGARLLGRRAVRRDTRLDSVRLRHRRLSSSVSRSQGRSQEASLAPRPTSSCSPTRHAFSLP